MCCDGRQVRFMLFIRGENGIFQTAARSAPSVILLICDYLLNRNNSHKEHMQASLSLADIMPKPQRLYDKNKAPKLLGQPTVVYFHVTVLSLDSVNEESMTYVTDIFMAQTWRDPRLRLPSNMSEEYRILDVDWLRNMWRPDSFFKNAKKVTFHEMSIPNHYLWLYRDKTLLYMAKY